MKAKSCFTGIHPVRGNSVNWPIANMTLDSHLTSPCSMWFMWVCWLNRVFSCVFFCLIAYLNLLFRNALSSRLVWLTEFSSLCCYFKNESHFYIRVCALNEAVDGCLCHKGIPKAFMCPGNRPKHYTRGDLKFLMWCDRPSHWTLLKGVNLLLETHSFSGVWQWINDSLLSQWEIVLSL